MAPVQHKEIGSIERTLLMISHGSSKMETPSDLCTLQLREAHKNSKNWCTDNLVIEHFKHSRSTTTEHGFESECPFYPFPNLCFPSLTSLVSSLAQFNPSLKAETQTKPMAVIAYTTWLTSWACTKFNRSGLTAFNGLPVFWVYRLFIFTHLSTGIGTTSDWLFGVLIRNFCGVSVCVCVYLHPCDTLNVWLIYLVVLSPVPRCYEASLLSCQAHEQCCRFNSPDTALHASASVTEEAVILQSDLTQTLNRILGKQLAPCPLQSPLGKTAHFPMMYSHG